MAQTIGTPASEGQTQPSLQDVERLAHEFWLERGAPMGNPEIDWLRAEQALRETGKREFAEDGHDSPANPESSRSVDRKNADPPSADYGGHDTLSAIAKVIGSTLGSAAALVNAVERHQAEERKH
jgi:hypothetical protein